MLFKPPEPIETEIFAELPAEYRRQGERRAWTDARRGGKPAHSFLEGPSFDREGRLYVTDIPFGRVFRISPAGRFELVVEYDGEPNGLKIHRDGQIFITDYRNGLVQLDPDTGTVTPFVQRRYTESFKGVNDLFFAANGDLFFTDQGRTGYQDPTGKVYRLSADGRLHCLFSSGINCNGVVTNLDESVLYVAMTNANAVWHLGLMPNDDVIAAGTFIQLSGGIGPDGLALTADGGLAIAHPGMGAVWITDRKGQPLYRVNSCGSDFVTNVAFGGPDNRTLFITDAGNGWVLKADLPVAGRPMFSHQTSDPTSPSA
ncbi:SMP-30/gluconolactonase/LRE family protein [Enterovirga sp. CN4-39]|uniref:SMP-30/gluconolactonase/LRE family protein n=1 Tax=Enterovirga sp. CN4-39 TaxID=3400910 RepID=UPI003BFD2E5B